MLILTNTGSDLVRVTTDSGADIHVHATWVDRLSGSDTAGNTNTILATAGTNTVVATPASSTVRNVRFLSLLNVDASVANTVTIEFYNGTAYRLFSCVLKAGYLLTYRDGLGWALHDASGGKIETPLAGRFLGSSLLTSASANFTTGPSTNTVCIRGVGGGGGGGGCTSVAGAASAAGGGGGGGYIEKTVTVTPNTAYAYTCGPLGAGSAGAAGANGTDSTFVVGATTYTAKGGTGGPQAVSATTLKAFLGGAGGVVSINGDVNVPGQNGGSGVVLIINSGTTEVQVSGIGANSMLGQGGAALITSGSGATGTNAAGYGAGGGGACTGAAQTRAGGSGSAGCWIVDEYS